MSADARIIAYVTKEDKKRIEAAAKRKGISTSLFVSAGALMKVAHMDADRSPARVPQRSDD